VTESEPAKESRGAKELEDLHVYKQARALANLVYALTAKPTFRRDPALRDQMRRSAVSILSNIAEGFERGTRAAFANSLGIAKGSCGELRAQATVGLDQRYIDGKDHRDVTDRCRRLSAGLARLIAYLKSKRPGPQATPAPWP
jgi:four helix bundle protein